jgi:hypothetical protein
MKIIQCIFLVYCLIVLTYKVNMSRKVPKQNSLIYSYFCQKRNYPDVHESVHRDITKTTIEMQLFRLIYYSVSALHVSGDGFAHHQEHLTVFAASDNIHQCRCRLVHKLAYRNLAKNFRWPFPITARIKTILTEHLCHFPQLQAYIRLEPWHATWPLFLISFPLHRSFLTETLACRTVRRH